MKKVKFDENKKILSISEAGYNWQRGMSNNAVSAYDHGEMPISKWSKSELLYNIADAYGDKLANALKKANLNDLRDFFLTQSSWHHTSKFYNKTNFYSFKDDLNTEEDSYDNEELKKIFKVDFQGNRYDSKKDISLEYMLSAYPTGEKLFQGILDYNRKKYKSYKNIKDIRDYVIYWFRKENRIFPNSEEKILKSDLPKRNIYTNEYHNHSLFIFNKKERYDNGSKLISYKEWVESSIDDGIMWLVLEYSSYGLNRKEEAYVIEKYKESVDLQPLYNLFEKTYNKLKDEDMEEILNIDPGYASYFKINISKLPEVIELGIDFLNYI